VWHERYKVARAGLANGSTIATVMRAFDTLGLEQGLDRVGDKILDANHGVKGGFAAGWCPEPEVRTPVQRIRLRTSGSKDAPEP
jgi:hypothetical protein